MSEPALSARGAEPADADGGLEAAPASRARARRRHGAVEVFGLFPALTGEAGGVQASGRVAWEGVARRWAAAPRGCLLFRYGERGDGWRPGSPAVARATRAGAIGTALGRRWPARTALVWHLGLLKLLPFFRLDGARVVVFLHGIEAWAPPRWPTDHLLRRVDLFLANSAHTWDRFATRHPRHAGARHAVVHLGVDRPAGSPVAPPGDEPPVALVIGRLRRGEDYKGHRELIAAWALVQQRVPGAELWIAGGGDLRPDLERLAAAGSVSARVRFWGPVSDGDKAALLRRARCLAMPSRNEGFGLVYLEAMRLGRPCLVSTLDAGREVVDPPAAGLAADPRDPRAVADAVCALMTLGPEWRAWSRRARERYESRFTALHFQERLCAALEPGR